MGRVHGKVKSRVEKNSADIYDAIRGRVRKRMRERGLPKNGWAELEKITGLSRKNLPKWLKEDGTDRIPAEMIWAMDRSGFASSEWLLHGDRGGRGSDAEARLAVARKVTDAKTPIEEIDRMLAAIESDEAGDSAPGSAEEADAAATTGKERAGSPDEEETGGTGTDD